MKVATWNLNSIRAREERLLDWLERQAPDILCLQELKVAESGFPFGAVEKRGYRAVVLGQPTYNGVAVLSLHGIEEVRRGLGGDEEDEQARFLDVRTGGVRVLCAYFPNGGEVGSDKWEYKLAWMRRLRDYLDANCDPTEPLALCGDFNVAPDDMDVARPDAWADTVLCHPDARAALQAIGDWGFVDVVRERHPEGGPYTWWDYRNQGFQRDDGLRIDHVFATEPLSERVTAASVDRDERKGEKPSDHAPVIVTLDGQDPGPAAATDADAETAADPEPNERARPKLVLIDGHSVAYRAFYGLPLYDRSGRATFSTKSGELTNAVYGFANMLIKTWNEERPDYMAVAFDLGRTFRDDLYEEYKGTREKMPEELVPQIDRIMQLVEAFGLPALAVDGFEADDILGTLARKGAEDGLDVLIVTGDSDAFQLIGEHVRVMAPGRLWSDVSTYDTEAVRERYGLLPGQLIDYKALVGDSSDNIPGVRGVGEKTALPLLQAYGSVEEVYAHLEDVEPTRARNALDGSRDMAMLSKRLVTIRTDVPVDVRWEECAADAYDRARVEMLFDELEFRSIRDRLPEGGRIEAGTPGTTPAAGAPRSGQMSMFGSTEGRPRPSKPAVTETVVVRDADALRDLVRRLRDAGTVTFDTETTSTETMEASLVGIALALEAGTGYYVPIRHESGDQLSPEAVREILGPLLADPTVAMTGHNAKYDIEVLQLAGYEVAGPLFDTMLAEFVLEPGSRLGLKALAKTHLSIDMTEITELIGTGRHQVTMADVPVEDAAPYAAADVDMTLRLRRHQEPRLDDSGLRPLLDDVELPLVPVLIAMELAGVAVDTDLLAGMSRDMTTRLAEIEDRVFEIVGAPFNLSSPQQLGEVLFERLGLEAPGARKTRTGKVSVAADVLESMRREHEVVDLVLEHRQLTKLKGTYVDALPTMVSSRTGRVHTSFNQTGAVSGRLSSQNPNLQNIPIRTDLGREVRRAFVVPDGWRMVAADYSQVELRIAAHLADDPGLKSAFAAGEDIHRATAATVLGVPVAEVTPDQRSFAKRVNFGLLYGMGVRSLASQAGIPTAEAQEFVDAYFAGFPRIRDYIGETKRRAREDGYVETLLGRRRYFPVLASSTRDTRTRVLQAQAEREAINHPMQGSAADIIKIAMRRVHDALIEGGYRTRLLLQVHDELVLEAPEDEVERIAGLVREIMEGAYPLDPPLRVDIGVGRNWLEVK